MTDQTTMSAGEVPAEVPAELPAEVPTSPFERVPAPLRQALERRGFTELTTVQIAALDAIDGSRDLRISSQTGSGKTVALGLAMAPELIARAAAGSRSCPSALIIVPTRELAAQVHKELEWLYRLGAGCSHRQRDRRHSRRRKSDIGCRGRPRVLVGTPGRLVDHIGSGGARLQRCRGAGARRGRPDARHGLPRRARRRSSAAMPTERAAHPHAVGDVSCRGAPAGGEVSRTDPLHVEGTRLGTRHTRTSRTSATSCGQPDRYGAVVNLLLLAG